MSDAAERFHCEVCDQSVLASEWGFGPWCDLYFGERRIACLPRTFAAIAWLKREDREEDARVLWAWALKHWDLSELAQP